MSDALRIFTFDHETGQVYEGWPKFMDGLPQADLPREDFEDAKSLLICEDNLKFGGKFARYHFLEGKPLQTICAFKGPNFRRFCMAYILKQGEMIAVMVGYREGKQDVLKLSALRCQRDGQVALLPPVG